MFSGIFQCIWIWVQGPVELGNLRHFSQFLARLHFSAEELLLYPRRRRPRRRPRPHAKC